MIDILLNIANPFCFIALFCTSFFLNKIKKLSLFLIIVISIIFLFYQDKLSFFIVSIVFVIYLYFKLSIILVYLSLLILVFLKLIGNFIPSFFENGDGVFNSTIPAGTSFFLITIIALYLNNQKLSINKMEFLSTVIFFPHALAGPILHKPLSIEKDFNELRFYSSFFYFCYGSILLFLSNILSTNLYIFQGNYINVLFSSWSYYLFLFGNFAGYSFIAYSYAKLFNINIPYNFDAPSISLNPSEFWMRWHRSLSLFFRNNLMKIFKRNFNLNISIFLIMIISAGWHGIGLNFFLWGVFHSLYIILYKKFIYKLGKFINYLLMLSLFPLNWLLFFNNYNQIKFFHQTNFDISIIINYFGIKYVVAFILLLVSSFITFNLFSMVLNFKNKSDLNSPYYSEIFEKSHNKRFFFIILLSSFVMGFFAQQAINVNAFFLYQNF